MDKFELKQAVNAAQAYSKRLKSELETQKEANKLAEQALDIITEQNNDLMADVQIRDETINIKNIEIDRQAKIIIYLNQNKETILEIKKSLDKLSKNVPISTGTEEGQSLINSGDIGLAHSQP